MRRHLSRSGVPVEGSKGEWGKGQHELNLRFANALEMADRHILMKQCFKEVADGMGVSVTFMAKPDAAQAGSSCHVHMSLWNGEGSLMPGESRMGPVACSDLFRWFLGGWIAHVPEFMPFYAPTVNSYKRFRSGSWAPTRLAWSYDNRTASFRVVGKGQSLRIECRIPGADANPYLSFAAALASGLDGIAKKTEPPPIFEGDVYAAKSLPCDSRRLCARPRRCSRQLIRPGGAGRRSGGALRALLRGGAGRLRYRGNGLGTQAVLRADLVLEHPGAAA